MAVTSRRLHRRFVPALAVGTAAALLASCSAIAAQGNRGPQDYPPATRTSDARSPEEALTQLHDALHLSPEQEPAWQAYRASGVRAEEGQARYQSALQMLPTLDSPHRMDLLEAEMRQELADLHGQAQIVKSFYAVLTPAQRQTFDRQTMPAGSH